MRIALRADASSRIGLGHVKRCLALAHALRAAGATVVFVHRNLGIDVAASTASAGFESAALPAYGTRPPEKPELQAMDARDTVHALQAHEPPDWIIVDHYELDAAWHRAVARATNARIAVIDDLADRPLDASLLVDPNIAADHRVKYAGRLSPGARAARRPPLRPARPAYAHGAAVPRSPGGTQASASSWAARTPTTCRCPSCRRAATSGVRGRHRSRDAPARTRISRRCDRLRRAASHPAVRPTIPTSPASSRATTCRSAPAAARPGSAAASARRRSRWSCRRQPARGGAGARARGRRRRACRRAGRRSAARSQR